MNVDTFYILLEIDDISIHRCSVLIRYQIPHGNGDKMALPIPSVAGKYFS